MKLALAKMVNSVYYVKKIENYKKIQNVLVKINFMKIQILNSVYRVIILVNLVRTENQITVFLATLISIDYLIITNVYVMKITKILEKKCVKIQRVISHVQNVLLMMNILAKYVHLIENFILGNIIM